MKIAIATDNDSVSAHFGRCACYTVFEVENTGSEKKILNRTRLDTPAHQPGMLPPFLNERGVNYVIAGGMGPRAQNLFKEMNIEPIVGASGKVEDVIREFLNGTLEAGESTCDHGQPHHEGCHH